MESQDLEAKVWKPGSGSQDVEAQHVVSEDLESQDLVARIWKPGYGSQDLVARIWKARIW